MGPSTARRRKSSRQASPPATARGMTGGVPAGLALLLCCAAALSPVRAGSWVSFRPPTTNGQTCIFTGSAEIPYFALGSEAAVEFSVQGPADLKLLTRHLPRNGKLGKRSYTLIVLRDGQRVLRQRITKAPSTTATLCSDREQSVGAAASSQVKVPDGRHSFRVLIEEEDKGVALRIFRRRNSAQPSYTSLAPERFGEIRTLVRSKTSHEYRHYSFSADQPLQVTVWGPTDLIIRTRLDLAPETGGELSYGIEVLRDGQPWITRSYTTRPLSGDRYKEHPDIRPSRSRRLDLTVPTGLWRLTIRPAAPDTARQMTARILIPEKDVGLKGSEN